MEKLRLELAEAHVALETMSSEREGVPLLGAEGPASSCSARAFAAMCEPGALWGAVQSTRRRSQLWPHSDARGFDIFGCHHA